MPKIKLHNQRMLNVMDYVIESKGNKVKTEVAFLKSIGFNTFENIYKIKAGNSQFTIDHIAKVVKLYGINGDYFFNPKAQIFSRDTNKTPLEMIRAGLVMLEKK